MTVTEILLILGTHWLADFVLQTDEMAKGKSKSFMWLIKHTSAYSVLWALAGVILLPATDFWSVVEFTAITFVFHTLQDYFTSRLNSRLYAAGKNHSFFVSIGFDQLLHFAQLLTTYNILFK